MEHKDYELKTLKEVLTSNLKKENDIIFAYLFGSYAKEKPWKESDIDVAVYLKEDFYKNGLERKEFFFNRQLELIEVISEAVKMNQVDLVILNQAPCTLSYFVIKEGILLFSRNEADRIKFEVKVIKEYLDYSYYLKKYFKAMSKRIREGRFGK